MKPNVLILRCYAKKLADDSWQAACVDLNLSAQGRTGQQAIDRLHWMIKCYICCIKWPFKNLSLPFLINYYWIKLCAKPYKIPPEVNACVFTVRFPIAPTD